jgi:predicted O-methyltransferase YrrM
MYLVYMYTFTQNWFLVSELRAKIHLFLSKTAENKILEIGSFEGQSTLYFADTYCTHKNSEIISVDPFDSTDTTTSVTTVIEERFLSNVNKSKNKDKIRVKKMYSDDFFKTNTEMFNFIYIDGSHEPDQIIKDATNALNVLSKGGILWFDDYLGGPPNDRTIQHTIDHWINANRHELQVVHVGYQVGFRKI